VRRLLLVLLVPGIALAPPGCRHAPKRGQVLALGLAVFSRDTDGRQVPGQATAAFLAAGPATWRHGTLRDQESNVFHKLLEYCPTPGDCGLLSVGGSARAISLSAWPSGTPSPPWPPSPGALSPSPPPLTTTLPAAPGDRGSTTAASSGW
jgi:hypothetical protein